MRTLIFSFLALLAGAANADTLYVTEFVSVPAVSVYYQAANTPALANQTVAISGTSARSAAFNVSTGLIRIHPDVACMVLVGGTAPTAAVTSMRMAADSTEYFVVKPGDKVAVIVAP